MKRKLKRLTNSQSAVPKKTSKASPKGGKSTALLRRKTDSNFLTVKELVSADLSLEEKIKFCRRKNDLGKCDELSDNELVGAVQKGQYELYGELFGRYQRKLFVYMYHLVGNKEEVEDLLQNVFSKAYKHIQSFDLERKFSSWIYRIAHNEAVNFLKRKSRRQFISWEEIVTTKDKLETQSEEKLPEEKWIIKEITDEVDSALGKLPEKYKQVLLMRYFSEYSYEAIAKILGKPVNTVGTLINRAKKKLLEVLNESKKKEKNKKKGRA